jgi:hypothetical protein
MFHKKKLFLAPGVFIFEAWGLGAYRARLPGSAPRALLFAQIAFRKLINL